MKISKTNQESLDSLIKAYLALNWFGRMFFPSKLAFAIEKYQGAPAPANAYTICQSMKNDTWFFHNWLFSCLGVFAGSELFKNYLRCDYKGVLVDKAAEANFDVVIGHSEPDVVIDVLEQLHTTNLLIGEQAASNRQLIAEYPNIARLNLILSPMIKQKLLSGEKAQANFNVAVSIAGKDVHDFIGILNSLRQINLLSVEQGQKNFEAITKLTCYSSFAHSIKQFSSFILENKNQFRAQIIQDYFDYFMNHKEPSSLVDATIDAYNMGLLFGSKAKSNWELLIKHKELPIISYILSHLRKTTIIKGLDAQKHFEFIIMHADPILIENVTGFLIDLLTGEKGEANYNALMYTHGDLFLNQEVLQRFHRIKFNQKILDNMLAIAEKNKDNVFQGKIDLLEYIDKLIPKPGTIHVSRSDFDALNKLFSQMPVVDKIKGSEQIETSVLSIK